jgi:hypothetical protein
LKEGIKIIYDIKEKDAENIYKLEEYNCRINLSLAFIYTEIYLYTTAK